MIRTRDLVATVGVLWLSHTAWNDPSGSMSSLSASIALAFYIPKAQQHAVPPPAVLDVDGDGTPEALASWMTTTTAGNNDVEHVLQVLDLRPLSSSQQQQQPRTTHQAAPFQPNVLLESETTIVKRAAKKGGPLHMTTGQVSTLDVKQPEQHWMETPNQQQADNNNNNNNKNSDRTLQYFCGTTWHDAAERCAVHCPSGQMSDCPDGEKCFADTPCYANKDDAAITKSPVYEMLESLHTTPAGGWPSIFTVWADTVVTMHSLTATNTTTTTSSSSSSSSSSRRNKLQPQLQLKQIWQVAPLQPTPGSKNYSNNTENNRLEMEWYDLAVEFVDALSAPIGSNAGVLLLTGTVYVRDTDASTPLPGEADENETWSTFVVALDALTGQTVWESFAVTAVEQILRGTQPPPEAEELLPVTAATRGSTSAARRRSLLPLLNQQQNEQRQSSSSNNPGGTAVANCLREYRGSLLTSSALPYQYQSPDDVRIQALHFDHQAVAHTAKGVPPARPHQRRQRRRKSSSQTTSSQSWLSGLFSNKRDHAARGGRPTLNYGRPNVVVTHNEEGIFVQSLKNGRSLCHLSLQEETLYADIDHDGTLDSLQVVTSKKAAAQLMGDDDAVVQERKWVERLAAKVSVQNKRNRNKKMELISQQMADQKLAQTPLCHLLALSGIPTKEELFSSSLCYTSKQGKRDVDLPSSSLLHPHQSLLGAPLLVVEPTSRGGRRAQNHRGHDIVAAVNSGFVSRIRGNSGRRLWKTNGSRKYGADFPTWDDETADYVLLDRVSSSHVIPSMRPIVLAGENSAALLAPGSGNLLGGSIATFPQPSWKRPRLVDFDGDGTLDLLVSTKDAVWGYKIVVATGASVFYRIIVGLLIMGLMLAFLRNRFGPHPPGKRSTDL